METEEYTGPPRGLLLALGVIGIVLGGAVAGVFVLRLQPQLGGGTAASGTVIMPLGVGSNQAYNFNPVTITVVIGKNNTVSFINKDSAPHTVTADGGAFDSGNMAVGATWTYTFNTAGNFSYHCSYHSWMKATVVVLSG